MERKRAIFSALGSHLWLKDQKIGVALREPFKFIFENVAQAEIELKNVLTPENIIAARDFEALRTKCPIWLTLFDQVGTEIAKMAV